MYTIIKGELPEALHVCDPAIRCRGLIRKLNLVLLVLLLGIPGVAFSLSTVNISSADPFAAEAGPDSASFTITRTEDGDITEAISVLVNFSGSADNGPDYTFSNVNCCFSVEIQKDALFKTVTITPVTDNIVEGPELAIITLGVDSAYELGDNIEVVIEIAADVGEIIVDEIFRSGFEDLQ